MLERLPDPARVAILHALKPVVFPIHNFVGRWYYTEPHLRLARISGTALWWLILGDEKPREDDPQTAEDVIREIYSYADRSKPLPPFRKD